MNSAPKGRRGRKGRKGASGRLGGCPRSARHCTIRRYCRTPAATAGFAFAPAAAASCFAFVFAFAPAAAAAAGFGRALQGSQTGTSTCLSPPATQSFQTIFAMKRSSPKYCLLPSFTRATFFCFTFLLGSYWSTLCTAQFWFLGFGRGFGGCFLSLESCWWGYICCCHIQYI